MEKDGAMGMVFDGAGVGWRDGKRRSDKAENSMAGGRDASGAKDGAEDGVCASRRRSVIKIPRHSRGFFICGQSPMIPATPKGVGTV